ncbi:MAG: hypothetical protein HC780_13465 [Leptolyngbyaceae cyanobacterium CSU_1_3]|nr:hypothetical protein [Leptolyngbyaceae cyanobacterium CSU_1_3]
MKTSDERMKLLGFGDRLLDAAQLMQDPGLQTQKKDARFLSQLLNLGSGYAALNPISQAGEASQFFLDTLLQSGNVQKGSTELEESLKNQKIPTSFLNYQWKLLTTTRWVSALKENLRSPEFINEILNAGKLHLELQATADTGEIVSSGIYSDVLKASNKQELINAANTFQSQFLEPTSLNSSGSDEGILISGVPSSWSLIIRDPLIEPNFERYIDLPIVAAAPAKTRSLGIERSVKSIERFIKLVEDEENHYPNTNRNTKMMITRLRKIFYNSPGWNRQLIPRTGNVSIRYTTKDQNTDGNRIYYIPSVDGLTPAIKVDERDTLTIDSQGKSPELFLNQEVKLLDGSFVDMGHVLAAMDAANHPASVSAGGLFKVDKNIDNCTWIGDLGSIIGKLVLETARRRGSQVALNEVQEYINAYAEPQDMLGDVDGIIISYGVREKIVKGTGGLNLKVSEILDQYYIKNEGGLKSRRFNTFAALIGLGTWQAGTGKFSKESDWLNSYATQVANSAAQYVAVSISDAVGYGVSLPRDIPLVNFTSQQTEAAEIVLRRFLNTLKIHAARE